jgi:hypothetical protein
MSARKFEDSRYESSWDGSRKYWAGTRRDCTKVDQVFERRRLRAPLQSQSVALQDWNSEIPLCWLPNVTKLLTSGKLHRSIYPLKNCPP